jgi:raffinose/stachyose/melibiose transport system substrate-binding protein
MKRKWLLSLLLVGIVTAMVTGCGGNNNSDKGASNSNSPASSTSSDNEKDKENDKPVTIKFVGWNPINQPLLDKFHEQNPNITVQYEQLDTTNYEPALAARMAGKASIDVIQIHTGTPFDDATKAGSLIDITGADYLSNLSPVAVQNASFENKVYGYTQGQYAIGTWYNKDLFAKAGITAPPTTWEEFLEACEKLKQSGVAPLVVSAKDSWTTTYYMNPQFAMLEADHPGTASKLKTGDVKWADPQLMDVFKAWYTLNENKYFLDGALGLGYDQALQAFQNGQAAMWIMGNWSIRELPADFDKFELGVFPAPFNQDGQELRVSIVSDNVIAGISWSKHQDAVKKFLEFNAQPEAGQLISENLMQFSTVKGVSSDFNPLAKLWEPLNEIGIPDAYALLSGSLVGGELASELQKVMFENNKLTPEQFAEDLQKVQNRDNDSQ